MYLKYLLQYLCYEFCVTYDYVQYFVVAIDICMAIDGGGVYVARLCVYVML